MATTFTPNLTLANPTPNDPSVTGTWGTLENTARTLLDSAITGILSLSVAGNSNVILTSNTGAPDQSRNRSFIFTGILTGSITILWPQGLNRFFTVTNSTTGAFTVTLGANNGSGSPAGATFVIAQNTTLSFQSDGTNITALPNAPGGPAGGDLTGAYPNPTIAATAITSAKMASGAAATNVGALSGDLSGTLPSPTVKKLNTNPVNNTTPAATGALLSWTGTAFDATQQQPALISFISGTQALSNGVATTVNINSVTLDTTSSFNTGTHLYTPPAGLYIFSFSVYTNSASAGSELIAGIGKNGTSLSSGFISTGTVADFNGSNLGVSGSLMIKANGTDTFRLLVELSNSTGATIASTNGTFFMAVKISN